MRIFLAAVAVLTAVAGCQTGVPIKDGTLLRFRPVLSAVPSEPAAGPPGGRQSTNSATQEAAARALLCTPDAPDDLNGRDDPALPLAGCDHTRGTRYVLGPGFLSGAEVDSVEAGVDSRTGRSVVTFNFTEAGTKTWAEWTAHNIGKKFAVLLKSQVLDAPGIYSFINDGTAQITVKLTQSDTRQLVREITGG